jgi:hypothetical protein
VDGAGPMAEPLHVLRARVYGNPSRGAYPAKLGLADTAPVGTSCPVYGRGLGEITPAAAVDEFVGSAVCLRAVVVSDRVHP